MGITFNVPDTVAGRAFGRGIKKHGLTMTARPADVLVVDYSAAHSCAAIAALNASVAEQRAAGGRTMFITPGFYQRNRFYAVSWDGIAGRGEFCNAGVDDRRRAEHGLTIKPWRSGGQSVVVCGQIPHDPSVPHVDILAWARRMVETLVLTTDRPIVFRPHPMATDFVPAMPGAMVSFRTLAEDLADAYVLVTFSSGTSGLAVLDGVPVVAVDHGSIAWPVAGHSLENVECPYKPRRKQWANELAHTQWTVDEMACGVCWAQLRDGLWLHDKVAA